MSSCTQTILQAKTRASALALFALPIGYRTFHPFHPFFQSKYLPYSTSIPFHHHCSATLSTAQSINCRLPSPGVHCIALLPSATWWTSLSLCVSPHLIRRIRHSSHLFFQSSSIPQKLRIIIVDLCKSLPILGITRIHRIQTQSKQTHCKDLRIICPCSFEPTTLHRVGLSSELCLIKTSFQSALLRIFPQFGSSLLARLHAKAHSSISCHSSSTHIRRISYRFATHNSLDDSSLLLVSAHRLRPSSLPRRSFQLTTFALTQITHVIFVKFSCRQLSYI